jgi:hypothetical protein
VGRLITHTPPHSESSITVKRLSIWAKLRLIRAARRALKIRKRNAKRKAIVGAPFTEQVPAEAPMHQISFYKRGKIRKGYAREKTLMPENFCLIENHDAVASFLGELRHNLTIAGQKLEKFRMEGGSRRRARGQQLVVDNYVDFATLRRITPASALVLASEFDRVMSVFEATDWLHAINIDQWDPEVFMTLENLGFLSLLGVEKQKRDVVIKDGIYTVPFLSGTKVHGATIDRMIRDMAQLADVSGVTDSDTLLSRSRVYDGLGEAIQNVEDHAYPVGAFGLYPLARKWWMTGAVEPSKKRFTIAIYDHGVSIPVSLPRWTHFADFRAAFAKAVGLEYSAVAPEHDGQTIAQAVQLGRSSTGKSWHGKGLPVIRDIIENCKDGTVRILSRNGEYSCAAGKQPNQVTHKSPITGTLVEWDMFL